MADAVSVIAVAGTTGPCSVVSLVSGSPCPCGLVSVVYQQSAADFCQPFRSFSGIVAISRAINSSVVIMGLVGFVIGGSA
jgi:hypothetical protein